MALARRVTESLPLRRALRRVAGTVCIIAAGREGHRCGLTATSVTSLSLDPPALLVCINRVSSTYATITRERRFSVNVLGTDQSTFARIFSARDVTGEQRFLSGAWRESVDGVPHLPSANATMVCSIESEVAFGSHVAVIGRVTEVLMNDDTAKSPLLYFEGDYRTLLPGGG